jgi:hypothetical protein
MTEPEVTTVGRLLKPKNGEPRLHKVIAVKADGSVKTVINRPAT